jgi:hypothetical protein
MFADPQTVTISGSAKTLNGTSNTLTGKKYATSDRAYQWDISHTYGRRHRHTIRMQVDTLVANPLVSGQNVTQSMTAYLTVDIPPGYDAATAKAVLDGFLANLTATSGANLTKLVGGES